MPWERAGCNRRPRTFEHRVGGNRPRAGPRLLVGGESFRDGYKDGCDLMHYAEYKHSDRALVREMVETFPFETIIENGPDGPDVPVTAQAPITFRQGDNAAGAVEFHLAAKLSFGDVPGDRDGFVDGLRRRAIQDDHAMAMLVDGFAEGSALVMAGLRALHSPLAA